MDSEKLTANERRNLLALLRQTHDSGQYRGALAVLETSGGKTVAEVAEALRVSRQSVYDWIEEFRHTRDVQKLADTP